MLFNYDKVKMGIKYIKYISGNCFCKRSYLFYIAVFLTFICCMISLYSQEGTHSKYGAFLHYNLNYHSSDFSSLPNVPNCCPSFNDGYGNGLSIGLSYNHKFTESYFSHLKLGYTGLSGSFKSTEPTVVSLNGVGVDGEFEHRLDIGLGMITLEHLFTYKYNNLYLSAGITGGITIVRDFSQIEVITKPDGFVTFLDKNGNNTGNFTRNDIKGQIQSLNSFNVFLTAGISYSLPLKKDRSLSVAPEIYYSYALTNVVKGRDWSVNTLRVGISLIVNEINKIESVDSNRYIDERRKLDSLLAAKEADTTEAEDSINQPTNASVRAVGISNDIELGEAKFKVEEFQSLNMTPILNYVFFDNNSAIIPLRYKLFTREQAEEFSPAALVNSKTLETYYHLLNIIGYRMNEIPDATLTVTGCNSDTDAERNNRELSFHRAKTVSEYLINIWKIEPERIKTTARNLPSTPSRNNVEEGIRENQRVEIEASNSEILKPFISHDTIVTAIPNKIRFYTELTTSVEYYDWSLRVFNDNTVLFAADGRDSVPEYIDWALDKDKYNVPRTRGNVFYWFIARDYSGELANISEKLDFDVRNIETKRLNNLEDKRIDNYSLILYQYNSSNLTKENESIADFIKTNLKDNSTIYVTGYTDEIGDGGYNLELSEKRARKLKEILSPNAFERGLGKSFQLFDNKLPEGRFYNRTVRVVVETPIN